MRHLIKGLIAAVAVMAAAPAMACGYNACWQPPVFVAPVAPVAYGHAGCGGCGWAVRERLPDPEQQYYYVNQGPTYTGPGNIAWWWSVSSEANFDFLRFYIDGVNRSYELSGEVGWTQLLEGGEK